MPRGTYLHTDEHGAPWAVERFSAASGPAGWRYNAEVRDGDGVEVRGAVDVVVDADWRQVAVSLKAGDVSVQGGLSGAEMVWAHTAAGRSRECAEPAAAFVGASPGLVVTVARLLALEEGQAARVRLVRLGVPSLEAAPVDETWALTEVTTYPTDLRPLDVERYEVTDPATGAVAVWHLAGDIVLDAPGLALDALDSPPTTPGRAG